MDGWMWILYYENLRKTETASSQRERTAMLRKRMISQKRYVKPTYLPYARSLDGTTVR